MNSVAVEAADFPLPAWSGRLKTFAAKVLSQLGRKDFGFSVLLCGDKTMSGLNQKYRGKEGPTDVLSFSQEEGGGFPVSPDGKTRHMGDIAVSLDTLRENACSFGVGEDEELRRLMIHGILHLDGMDHLTNDGDEPMLRLQEQILEKLSGQRILPEVKRGARLNARHNALQAGTHGKNEGES